MKEGIRYIEDILREVSEEEGIPLNELKELWKLSVKNVQNLTQEEGVHIISLPIIGKLFFNPITNRVNNYRLQKKVNEQKEKELVEIVTKNVKEKPDYTYLQIQSLGYQKLFTIIREKFGFRKKYVNKQKTIEALEKFSAGTLEDKDLTGKKKKSKKYVKDI